MKHTILIMALWTLTQFSFGQRDPLIFNFDTTERVNIDTTLANNIWKIASPQKTIFNAPYTSPNVIITDTINFYPDTNRSEFIIQTPTFRGPLGGVEMYFFHKYDTDTLADGGTIEVSYDGVNWMNLISSTDILGTSNYYDAIDTVASLNDVGFSGKSNGWEQTYAFWNYPPTDTLHIKFIFASDNIQNNREGWMIDSLTFYYNLGVGIDEKTSDNSFFVSPNPFTNRTTVEFKTSNTENNTMMLFDGQGRLMRTITNIVADKVVIERNNLTSGLYFFQIRNDRQVLSSGKLIIK